MVVGAPTIPAVMSKKAQAAAKRQAHATPLPSSRGVDPAVTAVAKKEEVVDDEQSGRPDKAAFDAEQAAAKVVIDALVASQVRSSSTWHLLLSRSRTDGSLLPLSE